MAMPLSPLSILNKNIVEWLVNKGENVDVRKNCESKMIFGERV